MALFGIRRLSGSRPGFHVMKSLSTKRGLYRAAIFFALLFLTSPGYARVSYVPVEAEGRGAALNDAISDALVQAIGQVNGKSIASEKAQQSIRSLTSGPDGSTASFSKDQSSKIFEKTRGIVKEYKVLDQKQLERPVVGPPGCCRRQIQAGLGHQATTDRRLPLSDCRIRARQRIRLRQRRKAAQSRHGPPALGR